MFIEIPVGKRAIDDKKKINIPGSLLTETSSDTLILFQAGFLGKHEDYLEHFGRLLANEFQVYIGQLRKKGVTRATRCVDDLAQIDKHLRDRTEAGKVFYVGHSMGMNICAGAQNKYKTEVEGLYGICAYPSIGDTRTADADKEKRSLIHRVCDLIGATDFGPFGEPLKKIPFIQNTKFAIALEDEVLRTGREEILDRIIDYFGEFGEMEFFSDINHCFNYKRWDLAPFNKDNPQLLVDDIIEFVYDI